MMGNKLGVLPTLRAFNFNTVPSPHNVQALWKFKGIVWVFAHFRGLKIFVSLVFQFLIENFNILFRGWRNWEFPLVSLLIDLFFAIAFCAYQLISGLKREILRNGFSILGFLFVQSIEEPLQILEGILLMATGKLGMGVCNQEFKIKWFDCLLVLFYVLLFIDNLGSLLSLRVFARVESPENFANLAVKTVGGYPLASL